MQLKDKVSIVTGASRGIGRAIAEKLASLGSDVVVVSTKKEVSDQVAKEIADKYKVKTSGFGVDVADFDQVNDMVKEILVQYEKVDILINNAGITKDNLMLRMNKDDWDSVINVNLSSVFNCTKAVLRPMLKKKYGRIINISSVVGVMGNAGQANYSASKAGIIGFTKSIAREFGAKGITCNAIAPGFILTEMIESLPKDYLDNIIESVPQKRIGKVDEVADVVSFIASDLSAYMTGQVLNVDGGMCM